jgi:hypothetical protein
MCTVSVVTWRGGLRLAANRDERRSRPEALPPDVRVFGRRRAILPLDPASGGTWIAASDAGLVMTVLNVTRESGARGVAPRSRGAIIPALLDAGSLEEAARRALALEGRDHGPFRLVIADGREWVEFLSLGVRPELVRRSGLTAPLLFTSSGLGDALVEGPRRDLFERLLAWGDWASAQDAFHRHAWPDRPHLSVCMRRPDARTVSHSVVALTEQGVSFAYHAGPPDRPAPCFTLSLSPRPGGVR